MGDGRYGFSMDKGEEVLNLENPMTEKELRAYWKAVLKDENAAVHRHAIAKMELEHLDSMRKNEFSGIKKA